MKKRILKTVIFAGLACFLFVPHTMASVDIMVNTDCIAIHEKTSSSSPIMSVEEKGFNLKVLGENGNWLKVKTQTGTGWVTKENLNISDITYLKINKNTVIWDKPKSFSWVIKNVESDELFFMTDKVDGYYEIIIDNQLGYVEEALAEPYQLSFFTEEAAKIYQGIDKNKSLTQGEQLVNMAKTYLGCPYVFGGNDLLTGVDCSAFTQILYSKFEKELPRTSKEQSLIGETIASSLALPGDLVFLGYPNEDVSHVGIYMGDGKMINASSPEEGITISSIFNYGGKVIKNFQRIF